MKSMRDKKKNLTTDRILDNKSSDISYYYDGPNGRVIYQPPYRLPKGYMAACHKHDPVMLFKTMKEEAEHRKICSDCKRN